MRILIILLVALGAADAYAQETGLATFLETAQIIVDKTVSHEVTASITLQSTSIQEIIIPAELEERIRKDGQIKAVIVTNEDTCVLGVVEMSCVIINVERNPADKGINAIQESTKNIGDQYIDEINLALGTDARFHSVFLHGAEASKALDISNTGKEIVSAVYTMFKEETDQMYARTTDQMIPKEIRDGGGFYDVARGLSGENTKMAFSMIPLQDRSLLQIKVTASYPGAANATKFSPLEYLKVDELPRSGYFASGFYPLNSIVQIVVLSPEETFVSGVKIAASKIIDGEKIPTDVSAAGWLFDPDSGQKIQGKYLFGKDITATSAMLEFRLGEEDYGQHVIIGVIVMVAIAAAVFYLRGYRSK
ncbi:MAG: hypothetical protein D9C04_07640 [Nitrosopumilus sp. B06]|nr:MAG: hypothetical protein D9C04_07640 [Nitrosopumilus sp. B06]